MYHRWPGTTEVSPLDPHFSHTHVYLPKLRFLTPSPSDFAAGNAAKANAGQEQLHASKST